ncbi:MAG: NUDIX domain-containing protein [Clostridiales bacterium]|jgi:ADP-ribose pyrophosphatase YjhB (NUDIX family)|nr:NUDIX domain-containing protein [Clostridiales bacterium]
MPFPTHIVTASGYVFDQKGNILLVKTYFRGWEVPGGQVENGETLEEGVLREILEESGITARVKSLVAVYSSTSSYLYRDGVTPVPTKVMFDFLCEYVSGECKTSDETSDVMWVPVEKALDYITLPVYRYKFQKALDFKGGIIYASYVSKPEFKVISERLI